MITNSNSTTDSSELGLFLVECNQIYQETSAVLQEQDEFLEKGKIWQKEMDNTLASTNITPFFPKEDTQEIDSTESTSRYKPSVDNLQKYINRPTLFSIGCTSFVAFCLWANYKIGKAIDTLAQDSWSLWRSEYSVDYLKSVPKETITDWLLDEIGERYGQDHIKQFFKEIEAEEKLLHEIVRLYNIARYLPWFLDAKSTAHALQQLTLLDYIKTVMVIWTLENAKNET